MDIANASVLYSNALFQTQVLGSLFGTNSPRLGAQTNGSGIDDLFSSLLSQQKEKSKPQTALDSLLNQTKTKGGLSANGRNLSLFDPESAYNLVSFINSRDVLYKAQFSELSQIQSGVSQLKIAGAGLSEINANTQPAGVEALLQNFVGRYNHWRESFNADVETGGLLDNVQAAEVSLFELEESVNNRFFGATKGINGLGDLGISIDPKTHFATLDSKQLIATLTANPQGAVNAIHEFSANFAQSAALLNSDHNFIPNQLDNLSRAIHYIKDNITALKQEFGTGDAAQPSGKIAQALAAYNQTYA